MNDKEFIPAIVAEITTDPTANLKHWVVRLVTYGEPSPNTVSAWVGKRVRVILEPEEPKT